MTRALVGHPGRVGERFSFRVSVFVSRWLLVALSLCWEQRLLSVAVLGLLTVLVPLGAGALARRAHSALDLQVERAVSLLFALVPVGGPGSAPSCKRITESSAATWLITVTPFASLPFSIITYPI